MEAIQTIRDVRFSRVITQIAGSDWGVSQYTSRSFSEFPKSVVQAGAIGDTCTFHASGTCLPADKWLRADLTGTWKRTKYGDQFAVQAYELHMPETVEEINEYLASGAVKGIGKATAKRVVEAFGTDTLRVMAETPEKLLSVRGIREDRLETIKNSMSLKVGYQNLQSLLAPAGFSADRIAAVFRQFGDDAAAMVKKNPYCMQKVRGISFAYCDRTARLLGMALNSRDRLMASLISAARGITLKTGDVYVRKDSLMKEAMLLLNEGHPDLIVKEALLETAVQSAGSDELIIRFPGHLDAVYLPEYDRAESDVAKAVSDLLDAARKDDKWLDAVSSWQEKKKETLKLTAGQEKAVRMACSSPLLVITGGAGTGKTTVALAVIESYKAAHPKSAVTLLAPTGKAARRLSEATGLYASTIHSALKMRCDEGNLRYSEPIPEGLVIVDEASMIDIFVMQALLNALSPKSRLVFLGDINQLPSVGPGACLAEFIRSEKVPVAYLTEIMRQGKESLIISNSLRINSGDCTLMTGDDFAFIPSNADTAQEIIMRTYFEETAKYGADNVVVLSPLKKWGNVSTAVLNRMIQERLSNPSVPSEVCHGVRFSEGDRIIQTRNTEAAANGEVGRIISIGSEKTEDGEKYETVFKIVFESGASVKYTKKDMDDIDLAYALTIHKSQGSEYMSVILPLLMDYRCPLYKRNLLYTAVTRAKKKLTLVGHRQAAEHCIMTVDTGVRNTLLANRIYLMQK